MVNEEFNEMFNKTTFAPPPVYQEIKRGSNQKVKSAVKPEEIDLNV